MKKFYSTFVALIVLTVFGTISVSAQQVPNPSFEDWSWVHAWTIYGEDVCG